MSLGGGPKCRTAAYGGSGRRWREESEDHMALSIQVALVSEGVEVGASDLTRVASALSKQVQRDFRPIWNVDATVDAFVQLEDVPSDSWPIIVMRNVQGAAGYHEDKSGQPFAVVEFSDDWSMTASHECLEMLADPFGRRLRAGNLPEQAIALRLPPKRVRYLVEVCDPSESGEFGYQVSGIPVSDFYTPQFFDPVKSPGVRYSFTGAIDSPRKVLDGGYVSWEDPVSKHWFQLRMFPDESSAKVPHVIDLTDETVFERLRATQSLRSAIDRVTKAPRYREGEASLMAARVVGETSNQGQKARAGELRELLGELRRRPPDSTGAKPKS
jgi:hypothetical protein